MAKKYKWGILAAGKIAAKFVADLKLLPNAVCYAIASRDGQRAAAFAGQWGVEKYYDSYEALANDPEVDIVYIASPHAFHKVHSIRPLQGRRVEK